MQYMDVAKFCLSLPEAQRTSLSKSGSAFMFSVKGNAFGYFETGAPVQWRFSLRADQADIEDLVDPPRVQIDKSKTDDLWLVIGRVEAFDEALLLEKIRQSYNKAASLEMQP